MPVTILGGVGGLYTEPTGKHTRKVQNATAAITGGALIPEPSAKSHFGFYKLDLVAHVVSGEDEKTIIVTLYIYFQLAYIPIVTFQSVPFVCG
ncbi:MAG: hypothetical protein OQK69_12170 [Gammaproteobacteria bacterium]|nr:hypothetical protein [Gammaproteobacteria bacterium]